MANMTHPAPQICDMAIEKLIKADRTDLPRLLNEALREFFQNGYRQGQQDAYAFDSYMRLETTNRVQRDKEYLRENMWEDLCGWWFKYEHYTSEFGMRYKRKIGFKGVRLEKAVAQQRACDAANNTTTGPSI